MLFHNQHYLPLKSTTWAHKCSWF